MADVFKMNVSQSGLEEANALMRTLMAMGAAYAGIAGRGFRRDDGKANNAEVVKYLEKGGRDIRPTDEDSMAAGVLFAETARQTLQRVANKSTKIPTASGVGAAVKSMQSFDRLQANQAMAKALRRAATLIQKKMNERVDQGKDNSGSSAKPVTEEYAKQRQSKYGVPADTVLKASGQLLDNLTGTGGLILSKTPIPVEKDTE
jgi:hypothetical protein